MDEVHELLGRQGGIARERDVVQAGFSRKRVRRAIREDRLRRLPPNLVTNVRQPPPDEQLRAAAIVLDGTVSHDDAALLWGLQLVTAPRWRHVTVARNRSRCRRPDTVVYRTDLCAEDRVEHSGMWVTSLLRTLLDLCRSLPLPAARCRRRGRLGAAPVPGHPGGAPRQSA